jgi:hypothetical protein
MNDFVDGEINDECASAILNLLSKARSSYIIHRIVKIIFLVDSVCQYWRLVLKLSSFSSDVVREKFIKQCH